MGLSKTCHSFVTFWLWLGIIGNVISMITSIIGYFGMDLMRPLILQIIDVISGLVMISAYVLLLNWKKAGFWLLTITALVVAALNLFYLMNLIESDYAIIGSTLTAQLITTTLIIKVKHKYWNYGRKETKKPTSAAMVAILMGYL